jgi:predicted alpha/beta-hydrolase family hydrolase
MAAESPSRIAIGSTETTADFHAARGLVRRGLFICGPSAGGHRGEPGLLRLSETLTHVGLDLVTFNFLYRERGLRRPDPMPALQQCMAAVVGWAVDRFAESQPVFLGGRSMGGRVASMLAADGLACDGLLLLAYPLHPAGEPDRLRAAHLARIPVPTLCFNGTRDRLCRRDLMEAAIAPLAGNWTMHWLEEADHSFRVPKSAGRTEAEILDEVAGATQAWLADLESDDGGRSPEGGNVGAVDRLGDGRR